LSLIRPLDPGSSSTTDATVRFVIEEESVMPETEIRRIRENDAEAAVELWDRMNREAADGGPLTGTGRAHLRRMLAILAWHRDAFCLVAVRGEEIVGFGLGRIDTGDGLLPDVVGEIQELYVPGPGEWRTRLADAVTARLRELGASRFQVRVAADDPQDQLFWAGRRFAADAVIMSRYE
jgi:hypothetical protein